MAVTNKQRSNKTNRFTALSRIRIVFLILTGSLLITGLL